MFAEEQLPRVVRQRDALVGHLKVHLRGNRQRTLGHQNGHGPSNRLGTGQGLGLHGRQEHDVAGGALLEQLPLLRDLSVVLGVKQFVQVAVGNQQAAGQSQRCGGVLIDQRRQRGEDGFISAALQADATRRRLDEEVTDQLVAERDLKRFDSLIKYLQAFVA